MYPDDSKKIFDIEKNPFTTIFTTFLLIIFTWKIKNLKIFFKCIYCCGFIKLMILMVQNDYFEIHNTKSKLYQRGNWRWIPSTCIFCSCIISMSVQFIIAIYRNVTAVCLCWKHGFLIRTLRSFHIKCKIHKHLNIELTYELYLCWSCFSVHWIWNRFTPSLKFYKLL